MDNQLMIPTANVVATDNKCIDKYEENLVQLKKDETECIDEIKNHRINGLDFYGDEEELTRWLEPVERERNSYTDDKRPYIRKYAVMLGDLERIRKDIEVAKETIKDIDLTPQQVKIEVKEYASKFEASLVALTHRFECQTEELKLEHSQRIEAMGEKINRLERMVGVMASPYFGAYNKFTLNYVVHTNDEFMFHVIINRIEVTSVDGQSGFNHVMDSLIICIYNNRIEMLRRIMERYADDTPLPISHIGFPYIIKEMLKKHTIFNATYQASNGTNLRICNNERFDSALHMAAAFGRVEIIEILVGYIAALPHPNTVVIPVPSGDNGNKICSILRENGVTSMPRF
jgi:hypothetical protein